VASGQEDGQHIDRPSVFLSYRRLDDETPPGERKAAGFIHYLQDQLKYELTRELGLPEDVLWVDRNRIQNADEFTTVIADAIKKTDIFLAVVSRNYVQKDWCIAELKSFSERLEQMGKDSQNRRIFRIDKQEVDEAELPAPLRGLKAVRFYNKDPDKGVLEYYYHGRVAQKHAYSEAIRDLAQSIYNRLRELGICHAQPEPQVLLRKLVKNDRNIFVGAPAADTLDAYHTLVKELWVRGFNVVPCTRPPDESGNPRDEAPPSGYLPNEAATAVAEVREALATAEASIHLIGERHGFVPDGLDAGIVQLQLAEARAETARRPGFKRLIWVPKIVPGLSESTQPRDALDVLTRFDSFVDTDEIESDTSARFTEFVLQRLLPPRQTDGPGSTVRQLRASVFIAYLQRDQGVGLDVAKRFKELGAGQIFFGAVGSGAPGSAERQLTLMNRADHVVFCWGAADELEVVEALDLPVFRQWCAGEPKGQLCLLACNPDNETKRSACELGTFGQANLVLDGLTGDFRTALAPLLAADR
jgi:hypothetical protein